MRCRHKPHSGKKVVLTNAEKQLNRLDPTRTSRLRSQYAAELQRRFKALKLEIVRLVLRGDAFGLLKSPPIPLVNVFCATGPGGGVDATCSPGQHVKAEQVLEPTANEFNPDQPRDEGGRWSSSGMSGALMSKLKSVGAHAAHLEHSAKVYATEGIASAVAKLPEPVQKAVNATFHLARAGTMAAFVSWTSGQALAERVAKERGASAEESRRLRGVLAATDLVAMKPISLGLAAVGLGQAALPASFVPPATAAYLAYSTARDPMATLRAAKGLVQEALYKGLTGIAKTMNADKLLAVNLLADALEAHRYDDWYIALLSVAFDEVQSLQDAIRLANAIYQSDPQTANAGEFAFQPDPDKIKAFQRWLQSQVQQHIYRNQPDGDALLRAFIQQGFEKGAGRAFDDVAAKLKRFRPGEGKFYQGSRQEFLASSFRQPESVDKLKILISRNLSDLDGVTDAMEATMLRSLADGLVQGKNPREIAKALLDDVDGIGVNRANTIARTEIIRAHAEGQLTALEQLGVEEVGVAVEWSTAGDERVCPLCESLEGVVLKLAEARGLLPRHPNCRCSFLPANVGEDDDDQVRSKRGIEGAFEDAGVEDRGVSSDRPESILNQGHSSLDLLSLALKDWSAFTRNVFCPTGPGGGVDASCSPGDKAAPYSYQTDKKLLQGEDKAEYEKTYRERVKLHQKVKAGTASDEEIKRYDQAKERLNQLSEKARSGKGAKTKGKESEKRQEKQQDKQVEKQESAKTGAKEESLWDIAMREKAERAKKQTEELAKKVQERKDKKEAAEQGAKKDSSEGKTWTQRFDEAAASAPKITLDQVREAIAGKKLPSEERAAIKQLIGEPKPVGKVIEHGMANWEEMVTADVNGIKFSWNPAKNDGGIPESEWAALDSIRALSKQGEIPKPLWESTDKVYFTGQKNKDDSYWEKAYGVKDFESTATGGDGGIVVYNHMMMGKGVATHEMGHNFATKAFGSTFPPDWSAYGKAQKQEPPVSKYGSNSPAEDFAEACYLYSYDDKTKAKLKSDFPLKYKALDELLAYHTKGGDT